MGFGQPRILMSGLPLTPGKCAADGQHPVEALFWVQAQGPCRGMVFPRYLASDSIWGRPHLIEILTKIDCASLGRIILVASLGSSMALLVKTSSVGRFEERTKKRARGEQGSCGFG